MNIDYSALILAAGNSSRMGKPKLSLLCKNDATFIENITKQYQEFGCSKIIIVVNNEGFDFIDKGEITLPPNIEIIINTKPEKGRSRSIKKGLQYVSSNYCFIQNIDNPVANYEVLNKLSKNISDYQLAKPITMGKGGHPILLSKTVIENIKKNDNEIDINFKEFLKSFKIKEVEVNDRTILYNINTSQEYHEFLKNDYM